jgi:hypothetical protein
MAPAGRNAASQNPNSPNALLGSRAPGRLHHGGRSATSRGRRSMRRVTILLVLAAFAFAVAGCGGGDESSADTTTVTETTTEGTTTSEATETETAEETDTDTEAVPDFSSGDCLELAGREQARRGVLRDRRRQRRSRGHGRPLPAVRRRGARGDPGRSQSARRRVREVRRRDQGHRLELRRDPECRGSREAAGGGQLVQHRGGHSRVGAGLGLDDRALHERLTRHRYGGRASA